MPWMKMEYKPGVVRDRTRYSGYGTWYDCSLVRFREGLPESWGGWVQTFPSLTFEGKCRSLHRHSDLGGLQWVGIGTHERFYVASDDLHYDVSPFERNPASLTNPFTTTNTSTTVTVTDVSHGRYLGQYVVFSGASAVGGVPAADFNQEHSVTSIVDDDNYTITVDTAATSSVTGGGSVTASYIYRAGSESQTEGGGWGLLGWGEEEWGGDVTLANADQLGTWTQDNWGEDLVACAHEGPIFYWDATTPSDRAVNILDLASADGNAPITANFIVVSHRDRHLLAFGGTEFGTSTVAPLSIRWCDQENLLDWDESSTTNTAGSLQMSNGSRWISAIATSREILAWSDRAMYSIQYIGSPFIFGSELIEQRSDIVGLHARATFNGSVFWMGRSGFYVYTGRVEKVDCPIWDYFEARLNKEQIQKVYCGVNREFDEVIWFYPSNTTISSDTDYLDCDEYVALNTKDGSWTFGSLSRTAWLEGDSLNGPIAASTDLKVYEHEFGAEDGSTSPASAINSYIESAPFELSSEGAYDRGDRFFFIRRMIPDVTFRGFDDEVNTPSMNIILKAMDYPGGGITDDTEETSGASDYNSDAVSRTSNAAVEKFTTELQMRLRGRAVILRAESSSLGTLWRLGTPRIDIRPDGQR